jgi:DNA invertase Pin-like site-specific DNA recombinase
MIGAREDRPGLKVLMQDARRGAFDVVVAGRFDRVARFIEQLVTALAEFRAWVSISSRCQRRKRRKRRSTSQRRWERRRSRSLERWPNLSNVIRERIVAGLEHVRAKGSKSGAAIGRPRAVCDRESVRTMRDAGLSWREIAAKVNAGVATVRPAYERKSIGCVFTTTSADRPHEWSSTDLSAYQSLPQAHVVQA